MSKERLERFRRGASVIIAEELIDIPFDITMDRIPMHRAIMVRLARDVYGKNHEGTTVKYPATWWQAFKEQYFPWWLLKRYPVERTVVYVNFKEIYPDFVPTDPDMKHFIMLD